MDFGYDGESGYGESDGEHGEPGPCGKMCGGFMTCCLGFVLLPAALFLLGWNEQNFVCESRYILYAQDKAKEVGCNDGTSLATDTFVYFSCPLNQAQMEHFTLGSFNTGIGSAPGADAVNFQAVSASQTVEMVQCKENCQHETQKNGMGQNIQVLVCRYEQGWSPEEKTQGFNSGFEAVNNRLRACPQTQGLPRNPGWPSNLAKGESTRYMHELQAGTFTLNEQLLQSLHPNAPVDMNQFASNFRPEQRQMAPFQTSTWPVFASRQAAGSYSQQIQILQAAGNYLTTCGPGDMSLGCVRISFKKSSATSPSVLTSIGTGGVTRAATVPSSWGGCGGPWQKIVPESVSKVEMIKELQESNKFQVWCIRLVGLCLCWCAIYMCLQPIAAAADVMGDLVNWCPCGGYIEDFIEGVVTWVLCVISCPVGCACGFFVIALVWVFMRPLVGGLMLAGAILLCCCGGGAYMMFARPQKLAKKGMSRLDADPL